MITLIKSKITFNNKIDINLFKKCVGYGKNA